MNNLHSARTSGFSVMKSLNVSFPRSTTSLAATAAAKRRASAELRMATAGEEKRKNWGSKRRQKISD
jgi:hypothetical protein